MFKAFLEMNKRQKYNMKIRDSNRMCTEELQIVFKYVK